MGSLILALNGGSSSLKYGAFIVGADVCEAVVRGSAPGPADHAALFAEIDAKLHGARPDAVGHRIVHGGPGLFAPVVVDAQVTATLKAASAFAPLHGPAALALIAGAKRHYAVPQVACFDTGFHQHMPEIAAVLPVPKSLRDLGVRRYGFHGLACQSIVRQLGGSLPERLVIAHLGSGASVTACRAGRSVDTSMGLTPSGGVVMATRSGDLDPGLLLFLLRERGMSPDALEDLVDRRSGLFGLSGLSGDLRQLRETYGGEPDARLAIAAFCRSVAKQIAAMIVSLGGIDMLVFSGGIGEHDPATRAAICADLGWAGIPPDGQERLGVCVMLLQAEEEEQIAREVSTLDALAF
jgi:acetate kinase